MAGNTSTPGATVVSRALALLVRVRRAATRG